MGSNSYSYVPSSGQVASITAPDVNKVSYTYDGPLLLTTTFSGSPAAGTVTRTYDADFRLATEAVTGGQNITFQYDNDSLLTAAGALTITRSPATGFVTGTTLGSVTDSRTYDSFGAEQTYSASFGASSLYSVDYGTRDALGRIVTKTETVLGVQQVYGYTYDTRGRLTDVTKNAAPLSHYGYDANGNRIAGPGLTASPSYDAQDRLLSYGSCSYAYKADGSLQTKTCPGGTTTYDYDSFGNLRGVTLPGGTAISYVIDGQNRRIGKKVNGVLVEGWLYRNGLQPVAWLDGAGMVKATFVYGLHVNVPEYMTTSAGTFRILTDHLGSPRLVVDTMSGAVVQRMDYDSFGQILSDTSPGFQPFGFAGGISDRDTGLVRFGVRDYDPQVGRWTNKDPIRFAGGDANLYVYLGADPINWIDPSGLDRIVFSRNSGSVTWFSDNGDPLATYGGLSGPFRRGALPDGYYLGSHLRRRTRRGMVCGRGTPDEIGFSLDLDPQFSTDRTDLRIHPDEAPPGTTGCIGISCSDARDFYNALNDHFNVRGNGSIPIWVGP